MSLRRSALVALVLLGTPALLHGQGSIRSTLTLSSTTITFPTVVEADYDAGLVNASNSITATIDATNAPGPQAGVLRTSILSIRATAATMGGGGKAVNTIQWQSGVLPWTGLTTTDATIESRQFRFSPALNDPWSATVFFRSLLSWATDVPGTNTATIVFTLTITTP